MNTKDQTSFKWVMVNICLFLMWVHVHYIILSCLMFLLFLNSQNIYLVFIKSQMTIKYLLNFGLTLVMLRPFREKHLSVETLKMVYIGFLVHSIKPKVDLFGVRTTLHGWHKRLANPHEPILQCLVFSFQLPLSSNKLLAVCDSCQLGKSHHFHLLTSHVTSHKYFDLMYSYV